MSEETKKKIGFSNSLGTMSDEERKRRSDSKKKPLMACNPINGETLFFNSRESAAEFFGVRSSAVSCWISGERNPTNGYNFKECREVAG